MNMLAEIKRNHLPQTVVLIKDKKEENKSLLSCENKVRPIFDSADHQDSYETVKKMIKNATTEIQVENFIISRWDIAQELVNAARRGVKVRVIAGPWGITTESIKELSDIHQIRKYLKNNGVKTINYNLNLLKDKSFNIDHVKLLVVDGKRAWIGGMCFTSDLEQNHDVAVEILGTAAQDIKKIFERAWEGSGGYKPAPSDPKRITEKEKEGFLPEDARIRFMTTDKEHSGIKKVILKNINSAKFEILAELFTFNDEDVIAALIVAKLRGVNVKVLLDPANYALGAPNKITAWKLQKFGIPVRLYNTNRSKEELMHSKLGVFDRNTTIIGSCNWTKGSFEYYHEIDAEIKNNMLAQKFAEMIEKDWKNSHEVLPPRKHEKFILDNFKKITDIFAYE